MSESGAGSDVVGMKLRAEKRNGYYVLNGHKYWITNGPDADTMVVYAKTEPEKKSRGITAFIVDTTRAGFHRGKTEPKLGIRASATCEIEFQDYVARAEDVLGEVAGNVGLEAGSSCFRGCTGAAHAAAAVQRVYQVRSSWTR